MGRKQGVGLEGGGGQDVLDGNEGDDWLFDITGQDKLVGGAGSDALCCFDCLDAFCDDWVWGGDYGGVGDGAVDRFWCDDGDEEDFETLVSTGIDDLWIRPDHPAAPATLLAEVT